MIKKITGFAVLIATCGSVFAETSNSTIFDKFNEELAFNEEINGRAIKQPNYQEKPNEIDSHVAPLKTSMDELTLQSSAEKSKAQIQLILKSAWHKPYGITNGSPELKARALFKLRPNGTIESIFLTDPSKSKAFNNSIKALKNVSGLPVPDNFQIFNRIKEIYIYFGTPSKLEYLVPPDVIYPQNAYPPNPTGKTVVRVLINVNGLVEEAVVQTSSGSVRLDRAAVNGVKKSLFKPYTENGVAEPVYTWIPIVFALDPE